MYTTSRIFVSSPGDVSEERGRARAVIERLGKDALFRDRLKLDAILWDDPEAPVPMLANLAPQESVNRAIRPSQCDIVVTIFWGRASAHSSTGQGDLTEHRICREPSGNMRTPFERDILLFRRTAPVIVAIDDPLMAEKRDQKGRVDQFFAALTGSYKAYSNRANSPLS